ncbi:MAG: BadF/BadG/BcrA/BcrD ATPase family protein [Mycobacterium leprae]
MPWVLGLDGGDAKTVALVANEKGRVLGRGESGPANYHTVGLTAASEAIQEAINTALDDAGLVGQALSGAFFAVSGVHRPTDRQLMSGAIARTALHCPVQLDSNAAATLAGATGGEPGVVVIADTGAIAYGENAQGNRFHAGGYGPILGDEGSGYDIGRNALTAALRAEDGRGPATLLTDRVKQRFMLEQIADLVSLVYGNPPPVGRSEVAGLVSLVIDAARENDAVAREILRQAGRELGNATVAVLRGLAWDNTAVVTVSGSGSVFAAGAHLSASMEQAIRSSYPEAHMCQPKHTPAYGAVLLALRMLGLCPAGVAEDRAQV